jgi:hypothetical protein
MHDRGVVRTEIAQRNRSAFAAGLGIMPRLSGQSGISTGHGMRTMRVKRMTPAVLDGPNLCSEQAQRGQQGEQVGRNRAEAMHGAGSIAPPGIGPLPPPGPRLGRDRPLDMRDFFPQSAKNKNIPRARTHPAHSSSRRINMLPLRPSFARLSLLCRSFLIGFATLASTLPAAGAPIATIAERSPLAQGVWWNPTQSGSGFEIFSVDGQIAVLWYTYDNAGRPTWYLAQGSQASLGQEDWPLLSHRWSNGKQGDPVVAGTLRLSVIHPEAAEISWRLGNATGKTTIEPSRFSGVINEVDRSGAWFDPARPGWGVSLLEQGDITAGALYLYDSNGVPTWYAGHDRGRSGINLLASSGSCPGCTYRAPTHQSAGRLDFNYHSETRLTVTATLADGNSALVNNRLLHQISRPASARGADRQLVRFSDAAVLKRHLDVGMMNLGGDITSIQFSASPVPVATQGYSTTNLQEDGVDEADVVKSDGRFVYTFRHDSMGQRLPALRVIQVDGGGSSIRSWGDVPLAGPSTTQGSLQSAGLYVTQSRLASVSSTWPVNYLQAMWSNPASWRSGRTHIQIFDSTNPAAPNSMWRVELDGHLLSSRRIGNQLVLVTRHAPALNGFNYGASTDSGRTANANLLNQASLTDLLPRARINGAEPTALLRAEDVHAPPQGARKVMADLVTVTLIDLTQPRIKHSLGVLGLPDTVYASTDHLFLVGSRFESLGTRYTAANNATTAGYYSDVHQLRVTGDQVEIVGSASVEGFLDNSNNNASFRLSEHQGRLRMVTSSNGMWGTDNLNRLTILEPSTVSPGLLRTVSYLPNAARPETLGKPRERLYGTRFLGDRLYAVTFLRIDPLYVVDLSNSADPRIAGALEIPGYSGYLHPLPNGLLLGFGQDAKVSTTSGDGQFAWFQGLQLSLFDASDASRPRELQRFLMGKRGSWSPLLNDHHAFSAMTRADGSISIGIPARIHDGAVYYQPIDPDSAHYVWDHSGVLRFDLRTTGAGNASLTQRETLITHRGPLNGTSDSGYANARSVMFENGDLVITNGRIWHQRGTVGPTGPH